jgi:hypothetical protein
LCRREGRHRIGRERDEQHEEQQRRHLHRRREVGWSGHGPGAVARRVKSSASDLI